MFFSKRGKTCLQFRGRFTAQEVLLEEDVFGGALNSPGFDMSGASLTIPVRGWYRFQMDTLQVVGCIAPVADYAGCPCIVEGAFARGAWSGFKQHLARALHGDL